MYDRKTWIVVALCMIILGVNFHYASKNREALAKAENERHQQELAAMPPAPAAGDVKPGDPATPGDKATLSPPVEPQPAAKEVLVTFDTPTAVFTLSSFGGGVKTAEMKEQTGALGPVKLNRDGLAPIGALTIGVDSFESTVYQYVEAESKPGEMAVFRGKTDSGLIVTKTWSVRKEGAGAGFQLDLVLELKNAAGKSVPLNPYGLFLGSASPVGENEKNEGTQFLYHDKGSISFVSTASFMPSMFGMKSGKDLVTSTATSLEYAGVTDQFFATVLRPAEPGTSVMWTKPGWLQLNANKKPVMSLHGGFSLPQIEIPKDETRAYSYRLFAGPKINSMLRQMENEQKVEWGDVMAYGPASKIARGMNWLLNRVHDGIDGFTGKASWGLAVIILTVLIRTAIWPLYNRSNRTAKRMAKLKPEMDKLKEKYPDDPTKVSQETMALYQKYGINPLGSCLPMFAQLPIFMGFFSMLNHAVEMRGHGFLWLPDLAGPDATWNIAGIPINVLPLIMAATSIIQMAMMPNTSADKTQATMMKLMPLMFLYICYNYAAALALYWTTSNLFSIGQTWLSNRLPEPELKAATGPAKKSFMQRLAEQAEEQQRMKKAQGRVINPDDEDKKKRPPRTGG